MYFILYLLVVSESLLSTSVPSQYYCPCLLGAHVLPWYACTNLCPLCPLMPLSHVHDVICSLCAV